MICISRPFAPFTIWMDARSTIADRITFILDHYAPASTIGQAENQKAMRQFCREQGIGLLFDVDNGVCHQVMVDEGLVRPGMILAATDSHTTTHGAFGAFGVGVGATDMARYHAHRTFVVPGSGGGPDRTLTGRSRPGVFAKDIILHVIGALGADYAIYKAIEFSGPVLKRLSVSERMAPVQHDHGNGRQDQLHPTGQHNP